MSARALVLGFFAVYWLFVACILVFAPDVFDQIVGLKGHQRPAEIADLLVATVLLTLLSIGVLRGWRWTFWLILIAFLAGILRLPATALELAGKLPRQGPEWYVVLTAFIGLTQFLVALLMWRGYRRAGIWGRLGTTPRRQV